MIKEQKILHCDFCEKSQHEVQLVVGEHGVAICNECVITAAKICMDPNAPLLVNEKPAQQEAQQ